MSYFTYLPKVEYNITKTKYRETSTAVDIFVRNLIKQDVIDKGVLFDKHTIGDAERPDITSFILYGSPQYDWIIFLANRMFDPYFDWPLSSNDVREMIKSKYGSTSRAKKIVHCYRQILQPAGDGIKVKKLDVDIDTYNSLTGSERERITKYDIEYEKNEKNRTIKVIDKQYVEGIFKEAQQRYGGV